MAGSLAAENETPPKPKCDFDELLVFMEKLFTTFETCEKYMPYLATSNLSRHFVFDTFADPIMLSKIALEKTLFVEHGKRLLPILKEYVEKDRDLDLDELCLNPPASMSEFSKSKYDTLRVRLAKLSSALLRLLHLSV